VPIIFWGWAPISILLLSSAWSQTFISGRVITANGKVVASGAVALEIGRTSLNRRYFLFRGWQREFIYFAELDLVQLLNVVEDPPEKKNLVEEKTGLAAELEQQVMGYLKQVEGKAYRPLLTSSLSP